MEDLHEAIKRTPVNCCIIVNFSQKDVYTISWWWEIANAFQLERQQFERLREMIYRVLDKTYYVLRNEQREIPVVSQIKLSSNRGISMKHKFCVKYYATKDIFLTGWYLKSHPVEWIGMSKLPRLKWKSAVYCDNIAHSSIFAYK